VQQAREAARRSTCKNNLKQIGIALHNYHERHKMFPPGSVPHHDGTNTYVDQAASWCWMSFILPDIDQGPVFETLDINRRGLYTWGGGPNYNDLFPILPVFICPSDEGEGRMPPGSIRQNFATVAIGTFPAFPNQNTFRPPKSNYMGVCGYKDVNRPNNWNANSNDGVLYNRSTVSFADIRDGNTNTFQVGERSIRCGAGTWIGSRNPSGGGARGNDFVVGRISVILNDPISTGSANCTDGFSSEHRGGAHFLLCDGSVKFISENINFQNIVDPAIAWSNDGATNVIITPVQYATTGLYQRLGVRADRQVVGEF
jgi:prepilin-type processing-associated H-X9-DG protein